MIIGVDGRSKPRIAARPLHDRPSIVRPALADVDLLPSVLTDISDKEVAGAAVETVAKWIAQTECKDFVGASIAGSGKHVVGRDRVVLLRVGQEVVVVN